jgi:hypothetical protein
MHFFAKAALAAASIIITSTSPAAAWQSAYWSIQNDSKNYIVISDQASDGCWTNIDEVKAAAASMLAQKGANVRPVLDTGIKAYLNTYAFDVTVVAARASDGLCNGYINASIVTDANANGRQGKHISASQSSFVVDAQDLNSSVMELVASMIMFLR